MRPVAFLGLGGLTLLSAVTYVLWPAAEAPRSVAVPAAPPAISTRAVSSPAVAAAAVTEAAPAAATSVAMADPPAASPVPRFDVVRVGARGSAVIAGRAAPGAEVLLIVDGGRELGRARADGRGEWVILPADPLPSGAWELSLRARLAGEETAGPDAVVVVVPDAAPTQPVRTAATEAQPRTEQPAESASGPIAVLIPPAASGAAPRILQGPQVAPPSAQARATPPRLAMDSVDYEEGGAIRFAGSAPPGASVRVYVDDRHAGDAVADAGGRWVLAPERQPPVGRNALRVDQLGAGGQVAARIEVPFQRDELPPGALEARRVVVQPGANLWRIARSTYGRGTHFTVIHRANTEQIRDPHRIFPGQIFELPGAEPASVIR
ncbi:LysM peptidoglycan-binding domain-containing protein [Roseomonas terrae]|uniref:LysM peptidoglycan-binding domain-containing protein n=1 Tax=Neoroseomonas terrae TaxID=424799 RepID=A0ABS5EHJ4_9PROT|nr:LysM peptidoglycan-binding domain-containing protein [Neoroseomonas terrae]MBR0650505.1 LysM peptidoglycan-binding domain-containing protein [Neoroseomonas terrae]